MTGKELIVYILQNNLENEPVFADGKIMGFITVPEAAVKFNVGIPTIYAWIAQGRLDYIRLGQYYISDSCELGGIDESRTTSEETP